jgi:hypothetical protein
VQRGCGMPLGGGQDGAQAHAQGQLLALVQKIGASGTPSFILARTNPDHPTRVTGIAFVRGA